MIRYLWIWATLPYLAIFISQVWSLKKKRDIHLPFWDFPKIDFDMEHPNWEM
jgi:hypothetical protein